jgi:hypothetical protein
MTDNATVNLTPKFEDILTGREVAEFLGITEEALTRYRIRRCKLGKIWLYFRQDVAQYVNRRMEDG